MPKPGLTNTELDTTKQAAREVWEALGRLRQWARQGANLAPGERWRPPGSAFLTWRKEMGDRLPTLRQTLETARDAIPAARGRKVRFGHHVQRNALTLLLQLLEEALGHLGDNLIVTQTAPQIWCEQLERKLEGQWDYLWLDIQDDLADIGPEAVVNENADGPEAGCWLRWKNQRHDVPKGVVYRLIEYMWKRDSASYDELDGPVFEGGDVLPSTVRGRVSDVNKVLKKIGIPWKLKTDATSRHLTKKPAST